MKVVVSGSFNRHLQAIQEAIDAWKDAGADVLSPKSTTVVGALGDFLLLDTDKVPDAKVTEDGHLKAIAQADLLWVVASDGYVGPSTAMEMGFAVSKGILIASSSRIADDTLRRYVTTAGIGIFPFHHVRRHVIVVDHFYSLQSSVSRFTRG